MRKFPQARCPTQRSEKLTAGNSVALGKGLETCVLGQDH